MIHNTNQTQISLKNDSVVELIKELSKLGVFRDKKKKKPKRQVSLDSLDSKQPSDMVGYVKTIGSSGLPFRVRPELQQITQGMTQQQIEDIQQRNIAMIETLRGEVEQQRLEDISTLGTVINPLFERFRGAQEPGAGQAPDPFKRSEPQIGAVDIEEGGFTETLNEGGPQAVSEQPEGIFAEVEEEQQNIPIPPRLPPREPIKEGGASTKLQPNVKNEIADYWGIPPLDVNNKKVGYLRGYITRINTALGEDYSTDGDKGVLLKTIREGLRVAYDRIPK